MPNALFILLMKLTPAFMLITVFVTIAVQLGGIAAIQEVMTAEYLAFSKQ